MLDHLIDDDKEPIADHRFTHTDAMAGSVEKIEVLAFRAANLLPLWHEHDNPKTMPPARELRFGKSQKKFIPGVDPSDECNTIEGQTDDNTNRGQTDDQVRTKKRKD